MLRYLIFFLGSILVLACTQLPKEEENVYLIVPSRLPEKTKPQDFKVHLIDRKECTLKEWKFDFTPFFARMDGRGNVFVTGAKSSLLAPGLRHNFFEVQDKTGLKLWDFFYEGLHHDFQILPNGKVAFIAYHPLERDRVRFYRERKDFTLLYQNKAWSDKIIVVNPKTKKIDWEWMAHEHINLDELVDLEYKGDIFHTNSIDYTLKNPVNGKPAFLLSFRHLDQVLIVEEESKKILWRSPKGLLEKQHDATFLNNGNILVFDNRSHFARVIEISPKSGKVMWDYQGGSHRFEKYQFVSRVMSGAQRLSNGNTLITLSVPGMLVEIDAKEKVVWRYFNKFDLRDDSTAWPYQSIFKTRAYPYRILK